MEVLYFCTPVLFEEFQLIIIRDMSLASASCVFVFLWIWGYGIHTNLIITTIVTTLPLTSPIRQTGSLFIAIVGMMEIVFSLPLAYMIYRVILGFKFFASLNSLCLFVIMAIGAGTVSYNMLFLYVYPYHSPSQN